MTQSKTVRLLMPQWQGGNNENYPIGSEILAWLAPHNPDHIEVRVPVEPYIPDHSPDRGIAHRSALLSQLRYATRALEDAQPDRIVTFGGDCLVEQAPISYLNDRYEGNLGVLWIDAHPDIKTPEEWSNAHTMVLGNMLGEGDSEFSAEIPRHLRPNNVMYGGLREVGLTKQEAEVIGRLNLRIASPEALATDSSSILDWIDEAGFDHIAIHLDLDVLDPASFRSVLFAEPEPEIDWLAMYPAGKMSLAQVSRVMSDVARRVDVVGLGICEHLPWDAINLRNALASFPVLA
ncbi:MAG: arginine deaminase [Rhodococcus erythropolis]|jgi:arginase|nr:arginine deaminase [Rhodococcus erythropolis]